MSISLSKTQPHSNCFMLFHVRCRFFFVNGFIQQPISSSPITDLTVARMVAFFLIWIILSVLPHSIELPGFLGGVEVCRWWEVFFGDGWGFLNPNPRDTKSLRLNGCNLQKPVSFWGLWLDLTKSEYQNVAPLMLAPGTRESQGLGCHVESFFYEDSSRGGDLWHWCCVELAPRMWLYDGRDSDPMTVSMPWEAVGRIFWNWHRFQNKTPRKMGRFMNRRSDTPETHQGVDAVARGESWPQSFWCVVQWTPASL